MKWFKDGQLLSEEPRSPKVQIFDTMLRVNNVQTEDGGVYQCFITLDSGLEIQSSGELRLGGEKQTTLFFSIIFSFSPIYVFSPHEFWGQLPKKGTQLRIPFFREKNPDFQNDAIFG